VIRWSRKDGEQYLLSEVEGQATKWRAFFRDGKWVQEEAKAAARKAPAKKKAPRRKARSA
jgi:DNA topoisomerase-1